MSDTKKQAMEDALLAAAEEEEGLDLECMDCGAKWFDETVRIEPDQSTPEVGRYGTCPECGSAKVETW